MIVEGAEGIRSEVRSLRSQISVIEADIECHRSSRNKLSVPINLNKIISLSPQKRWTWI